VVKHSGGLSKFLNEVTKTAVKSSDSDKEQITYIDIDDIESNPMNFYRLRNIEFLAGLISTSNLIEPLTVREADNGKYVLISGHRRRAAVQKLLQDGEWDSPRLPCIVKKCSSITIEQENGAPVVFNENEVEMLQLIASNRGQREEKTADEQLNEIKYLKPFAEAIYAQKRKDGYKGEFRRFFAEEIIGTSKSQLQRIESIEKMSDKVKNAVDTNLISKTAAAELSSMSKEKQDEYIDNIANGLQKNRVKDIQEAKKAAKDKEDNSDRGVAVSMDDNSVHILDDNDDKDDETEPSAEADYGNAKIKKQSANSNFANAYVADSAASNTSQINNTVANETKINESKIKLDVNEHHSSLIDVPETFDDPQREAEDWLYQEQLQFYQYKYEQAKALSESEENELKAAQWGIRASVAQYHMEKLKAEYRKGQ